MRTPKQSAPIDRGPRGRRATPPAGILPSNWQCWTQADCGGLAFAYGTTVDDCCTQGAASARGINEDQPRGCINCPAS